MRVSLSLFFMAARQAAISWALGFPTVEGEREEREKEVCDWCVGVGVCDTCVHHIHSRLPRHKGAVPHNSTLVQLLGNESKCPIGLRGKASN